MIGHIEPIIDNDHYWLSKTESIEDIIKDLKGGDEEEMDEATKFHAGGEVIFTKDSDAMGYEADLKRAGVKYTKEKVS